MSYTLVERTPLPIDTGRGVSNLTDREAMGLPDHYVTSEIDRQYEEWYRDLVKISASELVAIVENAQVPFNKRYAAGNVLSLIGDPRVSTYEPIMIDIPSWNGKLGLHIDEVNAIVEEYKDLGILRNWIEKETPEYTVEIPSFRMGKYPVTNKEYLAFLVDSKYSEIPTSWKFGQYPHQWANHPVYTLSEHAVMEYCTWLSKKTGRKFRLPTEAEWEYAAAGPQGLEFPWGETFQPDCANTAEAGIYQTTPIGMFPKGGSPFGCQDMAGNIEEYVSDFYGGYKGTEAVFDDLVEINGQYRVARGGSFTRFRDLTRCKRRHGYNPKEIYVMGFRLVEDLD